MFKVTFASALLVITSGMSAQTHSTDAVNAELGRIQSEYADVLALQGTAKAELLAIARVLRAKPEMAIDRTKAAGEYCFKSSLGTMVHYALQPEATAEDVVYEFDATQLLAAEENTRGATRGEVTSSYWSPTWRKFRAAVSASGYSGDWTLPPASATAWRAFSPQATGTVRNRHLSFVRLE
jgi:hypothetical protein